MMTTTVSALVTAALLAGCLPTYGAEPGSGSIEGLRDLALNVVVKGSTVGVGLVDPAPDLVNDFDTCLTLDDSLAATVNGVPMEVLNYGFLKDDNYPRCIRPSLSVTLGARPERVEIVVRDDSRELHVVFGGFGTARQLRLVSPGSGTAQTGERVLVTWSHPDDVLAQEAFYLQELTAAGPRDRLETPIAVTGLAINFTVPALAPDVIAVELVAGTLFTRAYEVPAERCDADGCWLFELDRQLSPGLAEPPVRLAISTGPRPR